jgi:hypothetical protein
MAAGTLTCTYDYLAVAECFRSAQGGTNFLNGVPFPYAQDGSSNCLAGSSTGSKTSGAAPPRCYNWVQQPPGIPMGWHRTLMPTCTG